MMQFKNVLLFGTLAGWLTICSLITSMVTSDIAPTDTA